MDTSSSGRPGSPRDGAAEEPNPFAAPSYPALPGQPGRSRRRFGPGAWAALVLAVGLVAATAVVVVTKGSEAVREVGERVRNAEKPWQPGECFRGEAGELSRAEEVPCTEPHRMEVFSAYDLADQAYPGSEALRTMVLGRCRRGQYGYVLDRSAIPRGTRIGALMPSEAQWRLGGRGMVCHFTHPQPRRGSITKGTAGYSPEQYGYLMAEHPVDEVLSQWPEQTPSQVPLQYREFAADLAKALRVESGLLDGVRWSEGPKRELAGLKAELEAQARQADLVARTESVQLLAEVDKLRVHGQADLRFRSALGLPVVPEDAADEV
ncbi:septum formation family protein [Kitasatospora sp. NPDC051853]|uniref:septum formation family protein n=1 Tax=Kitasatospora sp. NPDC051853 TaxID=3364058 RepID=UPI0037AFD25B